MKHLSKVVAGEHLIGTDLAAYVGKTDGRAFPGAWGVRGTSDAWELGQGRQPADCVQRGGERYQPEEVVHQYILSPLRRKENFAVSRDRIE